MLIVLLRFLGRACIFMYCLTQIFCGFHAMAKQKRCHNRGRALRHAPNTKRCSTENISYVYCFELLSWMSMHFHRFSHICTDSLGFTLISMEFVVFSLNVNVF